MSFTSSQRVDLAQVALDELGRVGHAQAVEAVAGEHVVADGHGGEGVRLLEHHAHAAPQPDRVDRAIVDVHPVELDAAAHARAGDVLVHPVQAAQEGGFAAPRGADDRGHLPLRDVEVDVVQGRGAVEEGREAAGGELGGARAGLGAVAEGGGFLGGGRGGAHGRWARGRGVLAGASWRGAVAARRVTKRERREAATRATRLSTKTSPTSTSAPVHAWSCQSL